MPAVLESFVREADPRSYLHDEGLDPLLGGGDDGALQPDFDDLARLHRLVRARRAFTVLEFGVGYSTLVIADALAKNRDDFIRATPDFDAPADAFRVFSVDTEAVWIERTQQRLPDTLRPHAVLCRSPARAGTFAGRICHFYDTVPDVEPDFVYLDGPDPRAVAGSVNGVGFAGHGRTPLAADLLRLEPLFVPGLMILVDGRVNNARFLRRNFQRDYATHEDPRGRFTTFELVEPPLGGRNRRRLGYCLGNET